MRRSVPTPLCASMPPPEAIVGTVRNFYSRKGTTVVEVAGVTIDPPEVNANGSVIAEGVIYAALKNGEIWALGTATRQWYEVPPVPNTPAAEADDEG